jgi:PAS domain S-box-containing protein
MSGAIKILIIEDLPADEELIKREIRKAGTDFTSICVETRDAFLESLASFRPDIILSDYALPQFDGMKALKLTRERDPHMPFIIVTGSMNEETAVECMKAGATDYVIKGHAGGIGPAIQAALEMRRLQVESEKAENLLRENEERYRTLFETMAQGVIYHDADGVVTSANPAAERIMGATLDRMRGRPVMELFGKAIREDGAAIPENEHPGMAALAAGKPVDNVIMGIFNPSSNDYRWIIVTAVPQYTKGSGRPDSVYMTMDDITDLKTGQDRLRHSLYEKEILLREIHHRVKNNMQIISSMLGLQGGYCKDPKLVEVLVDMQNRIKSMAIIHEELYRSNDFSDIDFTWCMQNLVGGLQLSYSVDPVVVTIAYDVENIRFRIDTSLPCSLIVNELVSNSLKHAFPAGRRGKISVSMKKSDDNKYTLVVKDNGIGLPENVNLEDLSSMGLFLVKVLVKQIGGTLTLNRDGGTEWSIQFNQ